ncbi:endonuclease domain-containing protein [Williamsia serinedens]|uniref:Very-short-patch-repair endonuclease n=1 Tax=Williamsia serinedens TaxID=391736 RepID=A0ABT1H298_9NOCA|nr:DUF559 domain-containing protein [Williamsia serinedens]MCP2161360.1 Very-short-patch-repair endonuclease [Williamsia serinedens]
MTSRPAPTAPGSVARVLGVRTLLGADPLADDPVLLGIRVDASTSARTIVEDCDAALQSIAVGLFPSWLPGSDAIDGSATLDLSAAETLVDRLCRSSPDYAPYLRAVASAALTGRPVATGLALEQRIRGALRIIARSYRRALVVVLTPTMPAGGSGSAALGETAEWVAAHGEVAVWIDVPDGDCLSRYPIVELTSLVGDPVDTASSPTPAEKVTIPPVAGLPAPNSPAEQVLERHLARQDWARDRRWNTLVATPSHLDAPMRVDLLWRDAMVVVEIDGADHRVAAKYAADRIRDNLLQRHGYIVLRYTNDQVLDDVAAVAAELQRVLVERGTVVQFPGEARTCAERKIQQ